jgi:UDP-2-acetamido-3-amino-2,3-dideoxy-glucuronate N-acetyltransferase
MAEFDDINPRDKLLLFSHEIEWIDRKPVPQKREPEVIAVPQEEPLRVECQDYIQCVKDRKRPKSDGYKGLQVLEILACCQRSLERNGEVISLENGRPFFVHETSLIDEPCAVGSGTKIWHFSHIMPEVTIGKNCVIGQNVFIARGTKIGNKVKIENNVSVYEGVTLADGVFCGPSCVFTNVINPRSHISRRHEFKPTLVKRGASLGANATIICGNTIGKYALVGAGAVVTKDIPDYALAYGNPAQVHGWICQCGTELEFTAASARCLSCGQDYFQKGNRVKPVTKQ